MCENPVSIHAILKVKILSFTMFVLSMQTIKTEVIKGSERFVKKKIATEDCNKQNWL